MDNRIPMRDLLSMFLGKEVTVYLKNKRVQTLTLREIHLIEEEENSDVKRSSITVEDSIGFIREILTDNIESIDFGMKNVFGQDRADETELEAVRALVKEKNVVASNTKFEEKRAFEEVIELLREGRYKECIARSMEMVYGSNDRDFLSKVYFTLSFVTNQYGDYDQSFYWLERYFLESIPEDAGELKISEEESLWWRYLFNTVEFCSYENLGVLLKRIYDWNRKMAIRSLSYVLALNNLTMQAAYVYKMGQQMAVHEWEELESIQGHLHSETDNKYHRFLRCREHIEANGKYQVFENDEKLEGLVYEFVPYKGYGFILGYDMIKYFFHMTETDSITVKSIRKEICSMSHVSEERLCQVAFCRTANSKRSYGAYRVV